MTGAGYGWGHGWVQPRPDGLKARCGGPSVCSTCQHEEKAMARAAPEGEPRTVWLVRASSDAGPAGVEATEVWPALEAWASEDEAQARARELRNEGRVVVIEWLPIKRRLTS
jgi:hypothetical protein